MNTDKVIAVMEKASLEAGRVLLALQSEVKRLDSPKDFVTNADLKSEEIILNILSSEYPDTPYLSEEKGGVEARQGYLWVIDPVDGTLNFFLQDDHWGISIALVENGLTLAGLIYLPAKKQIFTASNNTPARLRYADGSQTQWQDIKVNKDNNLRDSHFWIGWGKEEHGGRDHQKVYDTIAKLDQHTLYPQIRNSAVADMMAVAQGRISGYVFPKPEPFDIAAAALIVERAGGKVTDIIGNAWNPFSSSLLATNGVIHKDLLSILDKPVNFS